MTAERLRVEPAEPVHAEVLAELHRRCFHQGGWSPQEMLALIDAFGAFALIGLEGDEPVGLALGRIAADEAEVLAVGVLAARRRLGIGGRLLSTLAAHCAERGAAKLFLEVAADAAAAQALYRGCGFAVIGRRPGYYARPDGRAIDGLILARTLPTPCAGAAGAADADPPRPRRPHDPPPPRR